ncbi:MAG: FAD-binding oxidoreductase [Planctomycetaceae bacterium]
MTTLSFQRWLVILNGLVPCGLLLLDALSGQLGANSVNIALHITGILSLVFLLLSLLMTPLKTLTGWGGWIAFRRALGLYGFFYAVGHLVIYVAYDRAGSLQSTISEVASRRFLQVGAVAILLMVPLAVTSTNGMIRWLGAARWKRLHRLTYVAVVLGVLHYYMLVKSDVRQPLAFGAVLGILLGSRAWPGSRGKTAARSTAVPLMKSTTSAESGVSVSPVARWKGELKVVEIREETHNVRTFRLASPDGANIPFTWQPGQFLNVQLNIDGKRVARSYTIASSPLQRQWLELTIKKEPQGLASSFLHERVREGELLSVSGPAGRFLFAGDQEQRVLLIAGGVGLTPVMSILRTLCASGWPGQIDLVICAKTEADLIFRREIDQLCQQHRSLHVHITLTQCGAADPWTGHRGRISAEFLQGCLPSSVVATTPVFLCGPTEMARVVSEQLASLGVPKQQLHVESFGGAKSSPAAAVAGATIQASSFGVTFVRSQKEAQVDPATTLLEAAEHHGVSIDFECRSGVCGQCRVRLLRGTVTMASDDALTRSDRSGGVILACQARATSEVSVDC